MRKQGIKGEERIGEEWFRTSYIRRQWRDLVLARPSHSPTTTQTENGPLLSAHPGKLCPYLVILVMLVSPSFVFPREPLGSRKGPFLSQGNGRSSPGQLPQRSPQAQLCQCGDLLPPPPPTLALSPQCCAASESYLFFVHFFNCPLSVCFLVCGFNDHSKAPLSQYFSKGIEFLDKKNKSSFVSLCHSSRIKNEHIIVTDIYPREEGFCSRVKSNTRYLCNINKHILINQK